MHGIWLIAFVVQWILLALLAVLFAGVLRYLASLQEKLQLAAPLISRFELGEQVGAVDVTDLHGNQATSTQAIGQGRNVLLLLLSPKCGSCKTIVAQITEMARRPGGVLASGWSITLLFAGDRPTIDEVVQKNPPLLSDGITLLIDEQGVSLAQYGIPSVPTGLALDRRGRLLTQSMNPHANWMYKTLTIDAPAQSVSEGVQALITPTLNVHA